jgi:6-phosphogluconolactonase
MLGIDNPSFLTIDHTNSFLYANSEVYQWHEGLITAFSINQDTGALTYLNKQSTMGNTASYNMVEQTNQYVLVTNYGDRHGLAMFPINADGSLSPASDSHEFVDIPKGVVPDRQERSHVHCVQVDPTNTYALINDLGLDRISVYKIDLESGKLMLHTVIEVPLGGGPRHLVFHPNGQYVYVILELSATVLALKFDSDLGTLDIIQTIPALPSDFKEYNISSDIHVTPSGKYLYAANRGHNSLAIYAIDESTGFLTLVGHQSTKGRTPRNFAIDPTGNYVFVANQDSDNIVIFKIDHDTGKLIDTDFTVDCPTPVCLKFTAV